MGKAYVKFMVENPEYLKFMFLSDDKSSINIEEDKIGENNNTAFNVFKESADEYLKEINMNEDLFVEKILIMWSLVHGISVLIAKKSISHDENYLNMVEKMIYDTLKGMEVTRL
nr:TetR-like C-terminal domain-containing protein [Clostridium cavendishii]